MAIDAASGLITWTPSIAQAGSQSVSVRSRTRAACRPRQNFTVAVVIPNRGPTITSTPVTGATAGQPYAYDVEATDPDAGDVLTYSLIDAPEGLNYRCGHRPHRLDAD